MRLIRFSATGVHGFLKFNIKFNDQLTFLTGINGSGKTTALNAIVALVTPDLSVLSELKYQKIQVDLENDGQKLAIVAENKDASVSLCVPRGGDPFVFSKYVLDPDVPLRRQLESEAEHYRELAATHIDHPVLKLIAALPTPMFLGLDRRSQFDEDMQRRRYIPGRPMRTSRNVFSASLARSLMDASSLAEYHYRDALISSGKIAEELQQEMLLNLLTVVPGGRNPALPRCRSPPKKMRKKLRRFAGTWKPCHRFCTFRSKKSENG